MGPMKDSGVLIQQKARFRQKFAANARSGRWAIGHGFVFAATTADIYLRGMHFGFVRRFVVTMTLTLFALVIVGQGVGMTHADTKPAVAKTMSMSLQDHSQNKDCDGCKTDKQLVCHPSCANGVAVLAEPMRVQLAMVSQLPDSFYLRKLLGHHVPPDPHPPRSINLI